MNQILEVGKPYDTYGESTQTNGGVYDFIDNHLHLLRVYLADIKAEELVEFSGSVEFGLFEEKGVIFLLFRFEGGHWADAPFCWHLRYSISKSKESIASLGDAMQRAKNDSQRLLLDIHVIDTATNIFKVMRSVTFSPEFSEKLSALIINQINGDFSGSRQYARTITEIYAAIPQCWSYGS